MGEEEEEEEPRGHEAELSFAGGNVFERTLLLFSNIEIKLGTTRRTSFTH
jgi:hypothetical protein